MSIEIGNRVVCVDAKGFTQDGKPLNLIEGREYIIYGFWKCRCGISYDVGIIGSYNFYSCLDCKKTWTGNQVYAHESRFRKVEERKEYKVVHSKVEIPKEHCLS